MEEVNKRRRIFLSLSKLECGPQESQHQILSGQFKTLRDDTVKDTKKRPRNKGVSDVSLTDLQEVNFFLWHRRCSPNFSLFLSFFFFFFFCFLLFICRYLPPHGFRLEGEIPRRHSSNSCVY